MSDAVTAAAEAAAAPQQPAIPSPTIVRELKYTAVVGGVEAASLYERDGKTTYTAATGATPLKVTFTDEEMTAIGAIGALTAKHPKLVDKLLGSLNAEALRTLFTLVSEVVEVGILPAPDDFDPSGDTVLSA